MTNSAMVLAFKAVQNLDLPVIEQPERLPHYLRQEARVVGALLSADQLTTLQAGSYSYVYLQSRFQERLKDLLLLVHAGDDELPPFKKSRHGCLVGLNFQGFAFDFFVKYAVCVGQVSVDPGAQYLAVEGGAFQRRPTAFVQDIFLAYGPLAVEIHQGQVCKIAFSDIAAFLDSVEDGGVMAHFLHDFFETDFTLCVKFKETIEGMLHQRCARHGLEVGLLLFFQGMRRMVGGNDVDAVIKERCE